MAEERRMHESWKPVIEANRGIPTHAERREALHGAVKESIEQATTMIANAQPSDAQVPTITPEEHESLSAMEQPEQVAFLGKIAIENGIEKAVAMAQKTGSEYVIDALHDLLVDELARTFINDNA